MKNILVITNTKDLTVDYIINKYSDQVRFFRFNTDYFENYEVKIDLDSIFIAYRDGSSALNISECAALYYRKISMPSLEDYPLNYRSMMQKEMMTVIDGIAEIAGKVAMTRPSIVRKADNKIIQLNVAKNIGFQMPKSLITNDDQSAKTFSSRVSSIVKPISVGKVITSDSIEFVQTNMVKEYSQIEGLENSPAYFQVYQQKDYEVRLNIVGNKFFAVRIDSSDKIDWRKGNADLKYTKIEVPLSISEKCLKMMKHFDLSFAAFDFIVSNDEYYFLELNANGQWLWLEKELNLGIDEAIISILKDEKN